MREDNARHIELVRAIELEDREAALLTLEDRLAADAQARAVAGNLKSRKFELAYLAARADFAAARLTTRHSGLAGLLGRSNWPRWVNIVVPLVALAMGIIANEFGTDKRLDLLAAPLIGTVAWNLAVYLWVIVDALVRSGKRNQGGVPSVVAALVRLGGVGGRESNHGSAIDRAAASFSNRWVQITAPLNAARAARTLHLSAALFAAGLIGGIYLRALVIEYRAGWESTFLGPQVVHVLLSVVLGPASAVSGVAIPSVGEIAEMRWVGADRGGVNATPWIQLYTVTVAGLVIVPRLILAFWQGIRSVRLARNLPVAGREDFYIRRLLRASGAAPGRVRVTPYAYRPGEETRRRLTSTLRAALGDGTEVRFDEPVEYGLEDTWLEVHPLDPDDDYHLVFFTLSATPEAENHGTFVTQLAKQRGTRARGTIVSALVDEGPWRAHFAGQAGLNERAETRLQSWRNTLASAGIVPVGIELRGEQDDDLAKRIEAALVADAELYR